MNAPRLPPRFVPTLTEVLELDEQPTATVHLWTKNLPSDAQQIAPSQLKIQTLTEPKPIGLLNKSSEASAGLNLAQPDPLPPIPSQIHNAYVAAQSAPLSHSSNKDELATLDSVTTQPSSIAPVSMPLSVETDLTEKILIELHRRADVMLDYRLRESLSPVLARVCDSLIQQARQELASTMRDIVARTVAQELAKQRNTD